MPTAAKLVGSVLFAGLAYLLAGMFRQYLPPATQLGWFGTICTLIGFFCGWKIMGANAGQGLVIALNNGLRTAVTMVFLALVLFSLEEMYQVAVRKMYDGPLDALLGAVNIGSGFAVMLLQPDFLAVLILGGVFCGWLTEQAARRWP